MYREKLQDLTKILKDENETEFSEDIQGLIKSCTDYIAKVSALETIFVSREILDAGKYIQAVKEYDGSRHYAHENLITNVKILNQYCMIAGVDSMFTGNINNRIEIAEFAKDLIDELFQTRKL